MQNIVPWRQWIVALGIGLQAACKSDGPVPVVTPEVLPAIVRANNFLEAAAEADSGRMRRQLADPDVLLEVEFVDRQHRGVFSSAANQRHVYLLNVRSDTAWVGYRVRRLFRSVDLQFVLLRQGERWLIWHVGLPQRDD